MNSLTFQNHQNGSSQPIFSAKTTKNNAVVLQVKHAPLRARMASGQPALSETPAYAENFQDLAHAPVHTPKRHGSNKRRTVQVYSSIPPHIAKQLEKMRFQNGKNGQPLTLSAVIAALLTLAVQQHVDMQYGALIEPTMKQLLHNENQARDARFASLLVKIAIDVGQTKGIVYNLLARDPGISEQTRKTILTESRKTAIWHLKDRSPEILELIAWARGWMEEDKKATKG
jgi:hypothetical protein